jgi:ATP-binding cassette subfamily B (MDR/TAP) protein 8
MRRVEAVVNYVTRLCSRNQCWQPPLLNKPFSTQPWMHHTQRPTFVNFRKPIMLIVRRETTISSTIIDKKKPRRRAIIAVMGLLGTGLLISVVTNNISSSEEELTTTSLVPIIKKEKDEWCVNNQIRREITWGVWFWSFIWDEIVLILCVMGTAAFTAYIGVNIPRGVGAIVDVITKLLYEGGGEVILERKKWFKETMRLLSRPLYRLLLLWGAHAVLTLVYIATTGILGERFAMRLKHDIFSSLMEKDIAFFDSHASSEIMIRLNQDVQEIKHALKQCCSQGLTNLTQLIGSTIHLFILQPSMTLYLWLPMPFIYFLGNIYGMYLRYLSKRCKSSDTKASMIAHEAMSHIRVVRSYSMEMYEEECYHNAAHKVAHDYTIFGIHFGVFQALSTMSMAVMTLNVLSYGGHMVLNHHMAPGDLTSFLLSTEVIQKSLGHLVVLFHTLIKAQTAVSQVFQWIESKSIQQPMITYYQPKRLRGDIKFDHVTFAYPSRTDHLVLNQMEFDIPAGKIVAIVGPSGSGKSTIASLIERFYNPINGQITIDGYDIRKLDTTWLRQHIGYITQDPVLFNTTIYENIKYGRHDASEADVIKAAKLAHCHDFISKFPNRYHTHVGERGIQLSGGNHRY